MTMKTAEQIHAEIAVLLQTGRSREDVLRLYPAHDEDAVGAEYDRQYSAWPAPWLARVYHTEDVDAAIEMVLETLDDLLCARDEERLREALTSLDVERVPIEVLLAFLMGTFRARAALGEARSALYQRAEMKLRRDEGARADKLLRGLR